jgi:hypothetical protein
MKDSQEKIPRDVVTSDTDNATRVEPKDAPPQKRHKYEKFRLYNTGMWNGSKRENKPQVRRQDDLHRYDSLAASLNLTQYQRSRGRKVLDDLDLHEATGGISIDHIIFGICVVVANDDVGDGTRYWPHPESPDNDQRFPEVAQSLGLDRSEQMSAIQKVMKRTNL